MASRPQDESCLPKVTMKNAARAGDMNSEIYGTPHSHSFGIFQRSIWAQASGQKSKKLIWQNGVGGQIRPLCGRARSSIDVAWKQLLREMVNYKSSVR
jgi:hypothetical protein